MRDPGKQATWLCGQVHQGTLPRRPSGGVRWVLPVVTMFENLQGLRVCPVQAATHPTVPLTSHLFTLPDQLVHR